MPFRVSLILFRLLRLKKLPKGISASEAMKYVVSGGVTTVDENEKENEPQSDS